MSMMKVFEIAGSGLVAQSQRLNVVASNLANAESLAGPDGKPYRARHVMFQAVSSAQLPTRSGSAPGASFQGAPTQQADQALGVRVSRIIEDDSPGKKVFDPKHPLADGEGFVSMPNVNVVDEMVNMISASRSYQTNAEVMNTAKNLMLKTLSLGS
ncbi:MAG: flagellar basal body rod protein FlgC [Burkholderiales bacterium]